MNKSTNSKCVLPLFETPFELKDLYLKNQIDPTFYRNKNLYLKKICNSKLDYETKDKKVDLIEIKNLIEKAYKNFEEKRKFL